MTKQENNPTVFGYKNDQIEKTIRNHRFAEPATSIITGPRGGIPCSTK